MRVDGVGVFPAIHFPIIKIIARCGEAFILIDEQEVKKVKTKKEKEALHQINNRTELVVTGVY